MGATLGSWALVETSPSFGAEGDVGNGWCGTAAETSVVGLHCLLSTYDCSCRGVCVRSSRPRLERVDEDRESLVGRIGERGVLEAGFDSMGEAMRDLSRNRHRLCVQSASKGTPCLAS
jgi:hypothetical protein